MLWINLLHIHFSAHCDIFHFAILFCTGYTFDTLNIQWPTEINVHSAHFNPYTVCFENSSSMCPRIVTFFVWSFSHCLAVVLTLDILESGVTDWNQFPDTVCFENPFWSPFYSSICPRIVTFFCFENPFWSPFRSSICPRMHFSGACSNLRFPTGNLFALCTLSCLTYLLLHIKYQILNIIHKISNIRYQIFAVCVLSSLNNLLLRINLKI